MLLGYQSSKYSSLPTPKLYFRPCGYRNVNYFLTFAAHLYRQLAIYVKILINLSLWKLTVESKTIKLSHEIWRQSGKISFLYSEGHEFSFQPGDGIPWLKCSGMFLSVLKNGQVKVQFSLRQSPFITCVFHIHYLTMIRSTRFCIHMTTINIV
jgi:hypothetical protein